MNTFGTTAEYYSALSSKFNNGGYGNLKHPEMAQWFANKESAYGIIADTEAIISCLSDDDKSAATRAAFRSFRSMIRDVIRYAEFPNIHELPSACIIIAIDDSYDTIEKLDNISSTGAKIIGYCTAAAFWIGILGHVWGFFILGWIILFAFAIILKPFTASAEKKEYLACCKYRRWDLIRSGCIFDPVTGERLQ